MSSVSILYAQYGWTDGQLGNSFDTKEGIVGSVQPRLMSGHCFILCMQAVIKKQQNAH